MRGIPTIDAPAHELGARIGIIGAAHHRRAPRAQRGGHGNESCRLTWKAAALRIRHGDEQHAVNRTIGLRSPVSDQQTSEAVRDEEWRFIDPANRIVERSEPLGANRMIPITLLDAMHAWVTRLPQ